MASKINKRSNGELAAKVPAGFKLENTVNDGNCLFRATSAQLFGSEERHPKIRQAVVDLAEAEKGSYLAFNAENDAVRRTERRPTSSRAGRGRSNPIDLATLFQQRLSKMRKNGEYGAEIEVRVIADLYNVRVSVYSTRPGTPVVVYNADLPTRRPHMYLLHDHQAEHYSSLRQIGAAWPIHGRKEDALAHEMAARATAARQKAVAKERDAAPRSEGSRKRSYSESNDQNDEERLRRKKQSKKINGLAAAPVVVKGTKASSAEARSSLGDRPLTPHNSPVTHLRSTSPSSVEEENTSDIVGKKGLQLDSRQPAREQLPKPADVKVKASVDKLAEREAAAAVKKKALFDAIFDD